MKNQKGASPVEWDLQNMPIQRRILSGSSAELSQLLARLAAEILKLGNETPALAADWEAVELEDNSPYAATLQQAGSFTRFEACSDRADFLQAANHHFFWLGIAIGSAAALDGCESSFHVDGNVLLFEDPPQMQCAGSELELYIWDASELLLLVDITSRFSDILTATL